MTDMIERFMRKYDRIYDPVANAIAIDEQLARQARAKKLHDRMDAVAALNKKRDK